MEARDGEAGPSGRGGDATADWVRSAAAELLAANPLYPGLTL